MLGRIIKKLYITSFGSKWHNCVGVSVDIDTEVTIDVKSNKTFWVEK